MCDTEFITVSVCCCGCRNAHGDITGTSTADHVAIVTIQACLQYSLNALVIIIGASLNKPHIDCDNSLCMYVSNIYTCICCTWFPRSVYILKCSMHSGTLMWSHEWCTIHAQLNSKDDWSYLLPLLYRCLPWKLSMKTGTCRYKWIHNIISSGSTLVFLECTNNHNNTCTYRVPTHFQDIFCSKNLCMQ